MDTVTLITHTDGTKSIRYGIDPVNDTQGIEQYTIVGITDEALQEIQTTTADKVQALLSRIF